MESQCHNSPMEQMPLAGQEHSYFATVKLKLVITNLRQLHVVAKSEYKEANFQYQNQSQFIGW